MMRKTFFIAAFAAAAALAGAAQAASSSDSKSVDVSGSVSQLCILGAPSQASINLGQMAATSGVRTGKLTTIGDQTVTLPGSFCNYAGTHLTVTATALVEQDSTTPPSGFDKAVNFTANVSGWTSTAATTTTGAAADGTTPTSSSNGGSQGSPKSTDLTLVLTGFSTPGDGILLAGSYSGLVTITLGPDAVD
jgi:hypothetical protein